MGITNRYQISGEQPLISYAWTDVSARIGYQKFYGCMFYLSTGQEFSLVPQVMDAKLYSFESGAFVNVNYADIIDKDFDITINAPLVISGIAYVNATWEERNSGGFTVIGQATYKLYKVSGGVETLIGTVTGVEHSHASGSSGALRECVKMTCTRTTFIIGDTLRLNIIIQGKVSGGNSGYIKIWCDPANRNSSGTGCTGLPGCQTLGETVAQDTDLILQVPCEIDL